MIVGVDREVLEEVDRAMDLVTDLELGDAGTSGLVKKK